MRGSILLPSALLLACAATPTSESPTSDARSSAGGEQPSPHTRESVVGTWAEFWSVSGEVPTEEHVFATDGVWSWRSAPSPSSTLLARSGRWALDGNVLVVTVEAQDERASCATPGCEGGAARRVAVEPAQSERLELSECPPNDEARTLDAAYQCLSLGGRPFWRR